MAGKLMLPPQNGNLQVVPQQQLLVSSPMNDVQLVALMAAQLNTGLGAEADVATAMEIVAQACHQAGGGKLNKRVEELAKEVM